MEEIPEKYINYIMDLQLLSPALSTDILTISESLMFPLYEHAICFANEKSGQKFSHISDIPSELSNEFFSHVEIAGHIMTLKGLAALDRGDPALAQRMFLDATICIPDARCYIEPYFYSLLMGCVLGWDDDEKAGAAKIILRAEPHISYRLDFLLSRISEILWYSYKAEIKKWLSGI
jgi:hypothetical protein